MSTETSQKLKIGDQPIRDASVLGTPRMLTLGVQHMFAMFGATVLVPVITGLSVSTTLLFAGLGTLFSILSQRKKFPLSLAHPLPFLQDMQP